MLNFGVFNTDMHYSASAKDVSNKYAFRKEVVRFLSMCIWLRKYRNIFLLLYGNSHTQIHRPDSVCHVHVYPNMYAYLHICRHTFMYVEILCTSGWNLMSLLSFSQTLQRVCQ